MMRWRRILFGLVVAVGMVGLAGGQASRGKKDGVVMEHAVGSFDAKVTPQEEKDGVGDAAIGRMSLDKEFHGDLTGTSKGQMLAAGTPVGGSAGYVAMEKVVGTLAGRKGTFVLQHSATMTRGVPALSIAVVPDSGTDELVGLTGTMNIQIANGAHRYEFSYSLPGK